MPDQPVHSRMHDVRLPHHRPGARPDPRQSAVQPTGALADDPTKHLADDSAGRGSRRPAQCRSSCDLRRSDGGLDRALNSPSHSFVGRPRFQVRSRRRSSPIPQVPGRRSPAVLPWACDQRDRECWFRTIGRPAPGAVELAYDDGGHGEGDNTNLYHAGTGRLGQTEPIAFAYEYTDHGQAHNAIRHHQVDREESGDDDQNHLVDPDDRIASPWHVKILRPPADTCHSRAGERRPVSRYTAVATVR